MHAVALSTEVVPAGHVRQLPRERKGLYEPSAHGVQASAMAPLNVPAGHGRHSPTPAGACVPGSHGTHGLPSELAYPASQGTQSASSSAPGSGVVVPSGQRVHVDADSAPVAPLYVPFGHRSHDVEPEAST